MRFYSSFPYILNRVCLFFIQTIFRFCIFIEGFRSTIINNILYIISWLVYSDPNHYLSYNTKYLKKLPFHVVINIDNIGKNNEKIEEKIIELILWSQWSSIQYITIYTPIKINFENLLNHFKTIKSKKINQIKSLIITQNEKEAILFQNQPSFYINLLSYKDFQSNFVKILNTRKPTSDFLNFKHIPKQQIKEFETSLMLNFNSNNNRCLKTPFPLLKNAEIELNLDLKTFTHIEFFRLIRKFSMSSQRYGK